MVVKTTIRKVEVLELSEKAVSRAQQRFFGMVRAAHKGELKNPSQEVADVADNISVKDAKDFASTKHKKLPEKKVTVNAGYDYDAPGVTAIRFKKDGSGSNINLTHSGTVIASRTRKKTTTPTKAKSAVDKALLDIKNLDDPAKNLPGMEKEETIWERLKKDGGIGVMSDRERREDDADKERKERNLRMRYGKRWREFTDEAKSKKEKEKEIIARYRDKKEKGIPFSDRYGAGYIKDGKKKYTYKKR